jgi:hypothetical protein
MALVTPPCSVSTAGVWSEELATTSHNHGRYKEAEKTYVEVLGLRRDVLGDKH